MGVPRNALAGDLLSVLARRPNSVALALSLPLLGGVALLAPARAETKPAASVTAAVVTASIFWMGGCRALFIFLDWFLV